MMSFLGRGGLYTLATVAPILALLAVTPVVTTLLGKDSYGEVAVAISIYQLGSVLLVLGLPSMVTRDALMEEGGFPGATGYVVMGTALATILAVIAAAVAPLWVPAAFPGVEPMVVVFGLIAGAGLGIVTLSQAVLRAAERVWMFVAIATFAALLPPAIGLALIFFLSPSPLFYAAGLAGGYLVVAAAAFLIAIRHAAPALDIAKTWKAILVGLPTVPHSLAVPALLSVTMSVVIHTQGVALAGQLQVAVMLGTAGVTVLNAVNNAWAPMIFNATLEERPRTLESSTFFVSMFGVVLIAGFAVVARFLVPFIGRGVVTDSLPTQAAMVIAAAAAFHVLYLANIHLTFVSKRTAPLAVLTPLSAVMAIIVGYLMSEILEEPIIGFAMVWPVFYLWQAVFSYLMARFGPFSPVRIRWSLPVLALGFAIAVQGAWLTPQPLLSALASAIAAVAIVAVFLARRRTQLRE
ncbi:hypothetical protein [uncultured Microbacterium sp.]|uniref:hypothetical protein n=1 Tax=uncultured Microbacterium sp. TaxID=191216 RepID=UPI0026373785|nr:hypothetical protein [uncultured Microbacterium sp.]